MLKPSGSPCTGPPAIDPTLTWQTKVQVSEVDVEVEVPDVVQSVPPEHRLPLL